jgi:hypothetical protein
LPSTLKKVVNTLTDRMTLNSYRLRGVGFQSSGGLLANIRIWPVKLGNLQRYGPG